MKSKFAKQLKDQTMNTGNISKYVTVRRDNFDALDKDVNQLLEQGYQPYGSPYVTESGAEFLVCQAMTLCADSNSEI